MPEGMEMSKMIQKINEEKSEKISRRLLITCACHTTLRQTDENNFYCENCQSEWFIDTSNGIELKRIKDSESFLSRNDNEWG